MGLNDSGSSGGVHGNERSGSMKCGESLGEFSDYQLL
jgi:hypothetical protein